MRISELGPRSKMKFFGRKSKSIIMTKITRKNFEKIFTKSFVFFRITLIYTCASSIKYEMQPISYCCMSREFVSRNTSSIFRTPKLKGGPTFFSLSTLTCQIRLTRVGTQYSTPKGWPFFTQEKDFSFTCDFACIFCCRSTFEVLQGDPIKMEYLSFVF